MSLRVYLSRLPPPEQWARIASGAHRDFAAPLHIVVGNQAADADSIVASIVSAFSL